MSHTKFVKITEVAVDCPYCESAQTVPLVDFNKMPGVLYIDNHPCRKCFVEFNIVLELNGQ